MSTVFISGSRQIAALPEDIESRLLNMVDKGMQIVIGDSEKGVDSLVARYLDAINYPNVSVYSIHSKSRIPLNPLWKFRQITIPQDGSSLSAREMQVHKDRAMATACDYGLVIWQDTYLNGRFKNIAVSSGSLRNAIQMLLEKKPVTLYHRSIDDAHEVFMLYQLSSIGQLKELVDTLADITRRRYATELKSETTVLAGPAELEFSGTLF